MDLDVLFDADEPAKAIFDRVFVHAYLLGRLNDDYSPLHFSFYHVDVCIASAVERFSSFNHRDSTISACNRWSSSLKGKPAVARRSGLERRAEIVHAYTQKPDGPLTCGRVP